MQTKITVVNPEIPEVLEIRCHRIGDEVREIIAFVILYTESNVYEIKQKLYELEEMLAEKHFLRVSKSALLNLMKVSAIRPAFNSRFIAVLFSGEQVVITRKYVPALKQALKGDK